VNLQRISIGLVILGFLFACGVSEGDFVAGSDYTPCEDNVPAACSKVPVVGCTMGENKYIEGDFPGYRNFLVTTPADTTIVVKLFFKTRTHPGEDTEIIWYEPGCFDSYNYESEGDDIFAIAGGDRVFAQEQEVKREGDHVIEIFSDARTHYFARVELNTPMN
jgi:hypothetical protein